MQGRYRIDQKLGEGGMGVVYAARDERLDRTVALKMIRPEFACGDARERLWREARAAASVNHPNICQLFEVVEDGDALFITMELLEGESLAARLARGPLPLPNAVQTALTVLGALDAVHGRGLMHRDLKPSNVMLTAHGVKLLDFGLARPLAGGGERTEAALTAVGTITGTPQYMAPEQVLGRPLDCRADLFAVGAILYEMVTGSRAFSGETTVQVIHAIAHDPPPTLGGSAAIAALDRVVRRALAKNPEDRYPAAAAMADDLRAVLPLLDAAEVPRVVAMTRLIVLPFRVLRADADTDFLAFSLPDAITSSLSGLQSLVLRSSVTAAHFRSDAPDLKHIAAEADVDVVLTGTLLRAGDRLRVNTQLVEAPGGRLIWSQTSDVSMGDIFQLQDELTRRIVESLSIPLTAREQRLLKHDVPATAKAYEFYLRANELSQDSRTWRTARDLYLQCLDEDPRYAPAWAQLGRVYRVMAKYTGESGDADFGRAEAALRRALEINPDLPVAHHFYAQLEVELGRGQDAMTRLLDRARHRSADAELFAGLCHACRYCGLLEASVAAHDQARRLDARIRTSVAHTHFMLGNYLAVMESDIESIPYISACSLAALGRADEAVALLKDLHPKTKGRLADFIEAELAALEKGRDGFAAVDRILAALNDPEGLYYTARVLVRLGDYARALEVLERALERGFAGYATLVRDPGLDPLRANPAFTAILARADERYRAAVAAFVDAGGHRVLGLPLRV